MNIQNGFCSSLMIASFHLLPSHSQFVGILLLCWLLQGHKVAATLPDNMAIFKGMKEEGG